MAWGIKSRALARLFYCCTYRLTAAKQMWHTFYMRYTQLLIVALGIGVFAQALAVDPPSPASAPTATPAPASLTTAAPPQDPAAAAEQASAEAKAKAEAQAKADADAKAKATDKRLRAMGYKPMNTNGTMRYCKANSSSAAASSVRCAGLPRSWTSPNSRARRPCDRYSRTTRRCLAASSLRS